MTARWLGAVASTALLCVGGATIGCRTPEVVYQRVEIPIPVPCPEPPVLLWPDVPVHRLTPSSTPRETVEAYAKSVILLENALWQALIVLDGYRDKTPKTAPKVRPPVLK